MSRLYVSELLVSWAREQNIQIQYIEPGKPQQNAYVERYNRTVRHEWLDQHLFESIEHARDTATEWLWRYNNERPNYGKRRNYPNTETRPGSIRFPTSEKH